ncbi:hypothetical protein, partial [Lentzea aerocolonigenes]|uniref:hypothetical protein n=1 Tax=Lentzea aerocolonigenes TaxID=68170 RepID=UPI001E58E8AD
LSTWPEVLSETQGLVGAESICKYHQLLIESPFSAPNLFAGRPGRDPYLLVVGKWVLMLSWW